MPASAFWSDRDRAAAEDARAVERALASNTPTAVRRAFEHLVHYHERRGVERALDDDEHRRFMARVTEALRERIDQVWDFVIDAKVDAQDARDDEQFDASWRRSAIQLFLDHHADVLGAPVNEARRIGIAEDVELLDDELRRLGEAYGPLPDDELPRGLPRHHWWWWPAPLLGGPHERYPGWDEPR
ncbi:MAG: hypothetical protein IPH44_20540 [Myxococcales bacterium]|nr:hypothetical protein [Myxococcales bacterium]MBK7195206.1 hypothetical protein [Myxococcales bacterium]MBP6845083.1 hypothetical protein [Kofleriaceae bacterium]